MTEPTAEDAIHFEVYVKDELDRGPLIDVSLARLRNRKRDFGHDIVSEYDRRESADKITASELDIYDMAHRLDVESAELHDVLTRFITLSRRRASDA